MELDFSYETGHGKAQNELIFTVEPTDNEAVYRCDASNRVTPQPLSAHVKFTVQCKCGSARSQTLEASLKSFAHVCVHLVHRWLQWALNVLNGI